jgi:molecular chaperone DnaJ
VLGIPRDANRDVIRRAFRSRAAECHPDVSDDPAALERFRALAEAYEVLSHPEARKRYDRYGFDPRGVGGVAADRGRGSFGLFDDLLDFVATHPRAEKNGADVRAEVTLDFVDAIRGIDQGVRFVAFSRCEDCGGEGSPPGARVQCPTCAGRGRVRTGGEGTGEMLRLRVCGDCRGSGRRPTRMCRACRGAGRIEAERTVLVEVPPGTADGAELRLPNEGHAGGPGGQPGDLIVNVRVRPAPDYPGLRRAAAAGALLALVLLLFVLIH